MTVGRILEVRPLEKGRPSASDWIEVVVLALVFALAFATPPLTPSGEPNAPGMGLLLEKTRGGLCLYRNVTGIPCPTCGLTRGFVQLAHAHPLAALEQNPLTPFVFWLFAARLVGRLSVVFFRRELRHKIPVPIVWRLYEALVLGAILIGAFRIGVHVFR